MKRKFNISKVHFPVHYCVLFLCTLVIFRVSTRHVNELVNLMAWDELGYWGTGAYLAGYDWSSAVSAFSGYYSYGYPCILALLIYFLAPLGIAYQAAIILNGLFLTSSFLLSYYIGISYFGKNRRNYVLLAAVIVGFYANSITQSNFAWTECILIFLYWCLTALFYSINKKYKFYKLMLIGMVAIYTYSVHIRTIGIVVAVFLTLFFMLIYKKIPLRDGIVFFLMSLTLVIFEENLRLNIRSAVWKPSAALATVNTLSSAFEEGSWFIQKLTNIYGWLDLIRTFALRFFYFGLTTYMIYFFFLQGIIRNLFRSFKEKKIDFFIAWLLVSMLGLFAVMSFQLSSSGSYQALLYGRYQDIIVGPIYFMGIMYFLYDPWPRDWRKNAAAYFIVLFILYIAASSVQIVNESYIVNCNTVLDRYWQGVKDGGYNLVLAMMVANMIFLLMCIIRYCILKGAKCSIFLFLCMCMLLSYREYSASEVVYQKIFNNYYGMTEFNERALQICANDKNIYFYNATDSWFTPPMAFQLQFEMYDRHLQIISEQSDVSEKEYFIFVPAVDRNSEDYLPAVNIVGELVMSNRYLGLYKVG